MSLLSTFPLFPTVPWLAEKRSSRPGYLYRQSGIIRFSVFPATTIQPQLFDAKSLQFFLILFLFMYPVCFIFLSNSLSSASECAPSSGMDPSFPS